MKKYLFPLGIAAFVLPLMTSSCSSSDDEPPVVEEFSGELPGAVYSGQAASYEIAEGTLRDKSGRASLTAMNVTESGKAVFEVRTSDGTKFATYNATIDGDTYVITDAAGRQVGQVKKSAANRAADDVTVTILVTVTIDGVDYTFEATVTAKVTSVDPSSVSTKERNLARTWTVASMNIVLEGDVDLTKIVYSGNLKEFADAAQEAGAELNEEEIRALSKNVSSVSFDKSGLFSIEYSNGTTDAACWQWTEGERQEYIHLTQRGGAEFGNKFLSDRSVIKVDFTPSSVALTMDTDIKGSKSYTATLTIVLKQP